MNADFLDFDGTIDLNDDASSSFYLRHYVEPQVYWFTDDEIKEKKNAYTRQQSASGLMKHDHAAVDEYWRTGHLKDVAIAHRFHVKYCPFARRVRENSQYSLGDDNEGGKCSRASVKVRLVDPGGREVDCHLSSLGCTYVPHIMKLLLTSFA